MTDEGREDDRFGDVVEATYALALAGGGGEENEESGGACYISRAEKTKLHEEVAEKTKLCEDYKAMLNKIKEAVRCSVCLDVPRLGPVPMCPNGPFTCAGCNELMRKKGNLLCPTCRAPMAEIQSRLATMVLENIHHTCDLKGCEKCGLQRIREAPEGMSVQAGPLLCYRMWEGGGLQ